MADPNPPASNDTPSDFTYAPPASTTTPPPLTGSANISIREYIYFLPHPLPSGTPIPYTPGLPSTNPLNLPPHPFEPTNTLVLTSPRKTFVDLRYLKPIDPASPPLPNHGSTSRLEWGFAGTSSSVPVPLAPSNPSLATIPVTHSTWRHWLDSRFAAQPSAAIPADEGDMYTLSSSLTLEHGHAFHPHLDRVAGHEELWRDVDAASTDASGGKVCVVLRCCDDGEGVRGVVVRVGQFCQGIVVSGGMVATERWEWEDPGEEQEEMGWRRTARSGDAFLPCAVTFRPERVGEGGRVRAAGVEWVVEEAWEWE